jgi:hypothetical protein
MFKTKSTDDINAIDENIEKLSFASLKILGKIVEITPSKNVWLLADTIEETATKTHPSTHSCDLGRCNVFSVILLIYMELKDWNCQVVI